MSHKQFMDVSWKPISEYKPGPYRGYDECVLVGWSDKENGGVLGFAVAYRSEVISLPHNPRNYNAKIKKAWCSLQTRKEFATAPDLYALVITDIPGTMTGYVTQVLKNQFDHDEKIPVSMETGKGDHPYKAFPGNFKPTTRF